MYKRANRSDKLKTITKDAWITSDHTVIVQNLIPLIINEISSTRCTVTNSIWRIKEPMLKLFQHPNAYHFLVTSRHVWVLPNWSSLSSGHPSVSHTTQTIDLIDRIVILQMSSEEVPNNVDQIPTEQKGAFHSFLKSLASFSGDLSSLTCPAFLLAPNSLIEYSWVPWLSLTEIVDSILTLLYSL
jgi:hypothetical protein